ncbi:MAG: serine/threonine protein kinase [Phycisphaeraceae bacterium]|nr:serine/threonine protein kinase [Phycisphaeraceae bacterium]
MDNRTTKEEAIYHAALKEPPEGRSSYVKAACGDDLELLERVESLLKIREGGNNFLESPPFLDQTLTDTAPEEKPGNTIDKYKLLEQIGEGGMAVVYMAEQEQPIRRRVALKVIKVGMDTQQVIARFEAERQALALMDHPHIAKVLDAGATDAGRPYFVMELVKGVSITEYCDSQKLSTQARLNLFIQVCHALQHAHQKGIIHRDIKPSNVMVTMSEGTPVPKVIDFGIAKATNQRLTEKTVFTRYAHIIGTPAYMSPEQAELSELDVDTRSDIYSLGVLLYELLTGATPFSDDELRDGGYLKMQQVIRDKEPTRPSTKLSTLGETLTDVAFARQATPDVLRRLLQGDLDWIVMKSLEKARDRRYDTANGLASDIKRHLDNEPVVARPPSVAYKFHKAWRRNKVVYTAAGMVVASLIIGISLSVRQTWVAASARRDAEVNLYDSLLREARTVRIARGTGYRDKVFKALSQARDLDVPAKDVTDLRSAAVACMGDYVGLEPTLVLELPEGPNAPSILWAALHPTDAIAAFALSDGTVILRDVHSSKDIKDIARFECEHPPTGLCFAHAGNALLSLHVPQGDSPKKRSTDAVAHLFVCTQDGTWVQGKTVEIPHAKLCMATTTGFKIAVVATASVDRFFGESPWGT